MNTCKHCGHTGTDVEYDKTYIGGVGYKKYPYCTCSYACWKRWHKKCIYLRQKGMEDEYIDYCLLDEQVCEGRCETCKDKIREE